MITVTKAMKHTITFDPENQYSLMETIEELTKMREIKREDGIVRYAKVVFTGNLPLFDYNRGFVYVSIWLYPDTKVAGYYTSQISITTVDDGSADSFKIVDSQERGAALNAKIASEWLDNLHTFDVSSYDELNEQLREYGHYITYTG